MKKKYKILIIAVIIIASLITFYKWKQNSFLGMSTPEIETNETIINYADKYNIYGEIFVPKGKQSFDTINKYFSFGQIYVFDENLNLLNCNLESLGGECFQDISDDICNNFSVKTRNLNSKISGTKVFDLIRENTINISNTGSTSTQKYNYTIVYPWVKYSKACIRENSLKFMNCTKGNKYIRIITLNFDNQSY